MAVVLLFLNKHVTKTELTCQCIEKKTNANHHCDLTLVDDTNFQPYNDVDLDRISSKHKTLLSKSNLVCNYSFLCVNEPENHKCNAFQELLPENMIISRDFQCSENKRMFLSNIFNLDFNKIKDVAVANKRQTMNVFWCNIHRFRLTSTNFGLVLRAINRNRYPPSFFQTVNEGYNLDGVKSILVGK